MTDDDLILASMLTPQYPWYPYFPRGRELLFATAAVGAGIGLVWMNRRYDEAIAQRDRLQARCALAEVKPANARRRLANAAPPAPPQPAAHTFDDVFAAHGQGIPVPYLRALASRESDLQPRLADGPAWGLLQVIEVVRTDFNRRAGTAYSRQDLLDPAINVTIAASTLALIVRSYAMNHPSVANLQTDWANPRFIELLTFGWNAGFSERGGVGRVARYLEQRGDFDLTIDKVAATAGAAGASAHLLDSRKLGWSKGVARQYAIELAADQRNEPEYIEMPEMYVGHGAEVGPVTSPTQVDPSLTAPPPRVVAPSPPPGPPANPSGLGTPEDPYACGTCPVDGGAHG